MKRSGTAAFRAMQEADSLNLDAFEEFIAPCVFYPDAEVFGKIVAELPGVIPTLFRAVSALMGVVQAETSKK
jgi:hypothetical protein